MARAKVQLTGQLVEERRARAAIAAELELAHSQIASLQTAVIAAKQQQPQSSSPPQVSISIPTSTALSPPMSPPSVSTSSPPVAGKLSSSTSSASSETGSREGKELKKTKSEKRIRTDSAPKPGDAVAALGRAALSQSAVLAQTQPKPELQRHRTQLLRSEAAKRADEDATKEKETAEAAQLRKRDERRLRESVPAILKGEEVDLHSVKRLYTICSTDVGRRAFIKQLKVTMKETKNLVLPSTSFEVLVYLFSYCIQAMQTANKCVDIHIEGYFTFTHPIVGSISAHA